MTGISDRILDPDYILAGVVSRSKNFSLGKLFVNFAGTIFESTHAFFPLSLRGYFNLENTKLSRRGSLANLRRESRHG